MSEIGLLIDFGSTYTKVVAVDLKNSVIAGQSQSVSTVDKDILIGFRSALDKLQSECPNMDIQDAGLRLACSSAAGGLNLVVIGLVPSLTMKAARLAALGAGAKVKRTFSYKINKGELKDIEEIRPDIVLLAGGTDGGNEEVILHNARMLAISGLRAPILVAGNKACADEIVEILRAEGKEATITDNVLGDLDRLNVDPSRAAIRQIFMERIVQAKGLEKAMEMVDKVLMPTPMAVLKAAELIASGTGSESGLGDLIVVDIGGATTDVHSIAHGHPTDQRVVEKGLPEPYAKRTVEGDLGMRYNACSILEAAGSQRILKNSAGLDSSSDVDGKVRYLSENIGSCPEKDEDFHLDTALAHTALEIAIERHVGRLEQVFTPTGTIFIQRGKDLTGTKNIMGTGGIFAYGKDPLDILQGALYEKNNPFVLKPKEPDLFIDKRYILFAVGLLADVEPDIALKLGKKYLEAI